MLEDYQGRCGPYSAYLDVVSLNVPVTETSDDGDDADCELVDTLASTLPDPEESLLKKDNFSRVALFVDILPAHLKLVATLHYWDGLTQTEIARHLNISQSAVSQRLFKMLTLGRAYFGISIQ